MNDDGAFITILVVLAVLLGSWQVAAYTIRWRLRQWIERERAALWEDTRYAQGYLAALASLEQAVFRREVRLEHTKAGEI